MLAAVRSATLFGVEGHPVTVEVHVSTGLPAFQIVGLPDEACRESRDRVRAAMLSSELEWPSSRVTVNLAPTSRRKGGAGLDLAIAIGCLVARGVIAPEAIEGLSFVAELGLDGSLRSVSGVAPMVIASGASAKSQQALGTGVMGGMIAVVILALLFVPVFYVAVQRVLGRDRSDDPISQHPCDHVPLHAQLPDQSR